MVRNFLTFEWALSAIDECAHAIEEAADVLERRFGGTVEISGFTSRDGRDVVLVRQVKAEEVHILLLFFPDADEERVERGEGPEVWYDDARCDIPSLLSPVLSAEYAKRLGGDGSISFRAISQAALRREGGER